MLSIGYLQNWLDFKYPQTYSHLREELILDEIQRKLIADISYLKTVKEASLSAGLVQMDTKYSTWADKSFDTYVRSVLPSILPQSTIKPVKTTEDVAYWADILKKKNEGITKK